MSFYPAASALITSTASPTIDETTAGAILIHQERQALGYMLAPLISDIFLLGILMAQGFTYFRYQNDRRVTRAVVIAVLIISICFTAYLIYFIQWLFVENFGKFAPLFRPQRMAIAAFMDSLIPIIVQCFMSNRAYRLLNRAIWIPISICILCLISLGANIAVTIIFFNLNSIIDAYTFRIPELIRLTALMVADMIVTGCIVWGLVRSRTGWGHTDNIIARLVRMTLEGQVPPFVIAFTIMITFVHSPDSLLNATLRGMQSKFYAVGMMYSINARVSLRLQLSEDRYPANTQIFGMSSRRNPTGTEIHVEVETETYAEGPYGSGHGTDITTRSLSDEADEKNRESDYSSQAQLTGVDNRTL